MQQVFLLIAVGGMVLSTNQLFGAPSDREVCAGNLRHIYSAAQQWAIVYRISPTNSFPLPDTNVWKFIDGGTLPVCPAGGAYSAGRTLSDEPVCSVHGTLLEMDRRHALWRQGKRLVRPVAAVCVVVVVCFVLFRILRGARLRR